MWFRKSLFVLVSILTFGLVTPAQLMNAADAYSLSDQDVIEAPAADRSMAQLPAKLKEEESEFDRDVFLESLLLQAESQSFQKFGSKIKPVIENEFRGIILPGMEQAIKETADQFPEENLKNLTITEQPGAGYSEKIFHIKNGQSGKDIIRFHVRRDNPPQSGYWFNFHYHTYHDDFQSHHELGSIFWAKDTPPKWLS